MRIKAKELFQIVIALLPTIYLLFLWRNLPDKIPMHRNISGEIDRYGSKTELFWLVLLLPVFIYVLLKIIPKIDPKYNFTKMEKTYHSLEYILITFMSVLSFIIIFSAKSGEDFNSKSLLIIIIAFFIILGKYLKNIQPNYFIGIRTPWTLENENIWQKTHILTSYLWIWGGIVGILGILFISEKNSIYLFLLLLGFLTVIPVIYSYWLFKKK
jgi:uncharacterized membrane protein